MRMLAALLLCLLAGQVRADDWTREDTYRQVAVGTLQVIDCAQTRYAFKNPGYKEQNPILGDHPSMGRINNLCAAAIIGHIIVSNALPPIWRARFQYATIAVEGWVVIDNHRVGVTLGMLF